MKKIIIVVFLTFGLNIFAQEKLTEGSITMQITMSSENEQVNASLQAVGELKPITYFKGKKSRTEMNNPMAGETISIVDNAAKQMLVLMNNPVLGKKYIKKSTEISDKELKNVIVTATGKTKSFLGYLCKGYDVIIKNDGSEMKMTMYTTDKISAPSKDVSTLGDKVEGFPMYLEMSISQEPVIKTTAEVTEVKSEKVDDSIFKMIIPEGYTEMATGN